MSSTTVNLKVVLLDDAEIEIPVQQRLVTSDFRDIVASQVNIQETQYFGLSYIDENGYKHWLQEDRRVLDHDFPRRAGSTQKTPLLYLGIKFYVESISYLTDSITYEQFYLQSRKLIAKGDLECDSETVFYLGALTMQVCHGDFVEASGARAKLRKMPVLPLRTLKQHPSLDFCEGKVVDHYQTMVGMPKGDAMLEYLEMIQRLPSYGVHFFEVKSSSGIPWWLGIGNVGISIYDHNDKRTPRETFNWERIENFFYRDKKFSLIVFDPKRISSSRRSFIPGNTKTHVWHAITAALAKTIYSMAESTKHFCLDNAERQRSKVEIEEVLFAPDITVTEIIHRPSTPHYEQSEVRPPQRNNVAYEITHRRHSFCRPVHSSASLVRPQGSAVTLDRHRSIHPLCSTSANSRSYGSLHTASTGLLNASVASGSDTGISTSMLEELAAQQHLMQQQQHESGEVFDDPRPTETDEEKEKIFEAMKEKYEQLEERKQGLMKLFEQKLEQLKAVCIEEGELIGELPEEYPCLPNEKLPTLRKRIGANYALSPLLIHSPQTPSNAGELTPQLPHRSLRESDTPLGVINVDGLSPGDQSGSNLSLEYEVQKQIVSAQMRLAHERSATKSVRRQRKDDLKKAREKLRQLELRINGTRKSSLDSSMLGLSIATSSRGSLDEDISEGQLSLSSSEMLDGGGQINPYNTVSGVPAYLSPTVNARRRVFGHIIRRVTNSWSKLAVFNSESMLASRRMTSSRGSLPEFSCPSVASVPSGTAESDPHEFRRDSYASQKSLPVVASRGLAPSHRRSHHCSPARARPAVGVDDPAPPAAAQTACDSGFVSLHTPSSSQRQLPPDISPNTQRRNLLFYRTRYPYPHHFSNSDSQLSAAEKPPPPPPAPSQPKQFWYQPPEGDLDALPPSGEAAGQKKFWYVPPPQLEHTEFEKPLETADCLQYSEETRRRLAAAAQRSGTTDGR